MTFRKPCLTDDQVNHPRVVVGIPSEWEIQKANSKVRNKDSPLCDPGFAFGPNPIVYDAQTLYCGRRGEGDCHVPGCDGAVDADPFLGDGDTVVETEPDVVLVFATKPDGRAAHGCFNGSSLVEW